MNFVTNVLKKYIQIEPQEGADDVQPSTTGAENEAKQPETECGSKKPTKSHPRHSVLKLFDPFYPGSPEHSQSHTQLGTNDSDESGNPQSLSSEVSDTSFLDACNTATDETSNGTVIPKEKILESDESFMKFESPVKVDVAPPTCEPFQTAEEKSVLQSSQQSTSNNENITESEIVSVISKRLTIRPNIRIRSKFTLTEEEQKNYILTDLPLQSDIRYYEPELEQADNIAGQAAEPEEPLDNIQIDPNPEVEIHPDPEIEELQINEENIQPDENIEIAEINTEEISCESREVESSLSTEVIPEKKTESEEIILTQKISSVNPEIAVGTQLIYIHQDDEREAELHLDSGVDSIESPKSPKSQKSDFEDSERGEEEDIDLEREDSSLPYEKLNQITVQPREESESQIIPKEESNTDFEESETGKKKLNQTTSDSKPESTSQILIEQESGTCSPNKNLSQTTGETKRESAGQKTPEGESKTDFEDSGSREKQNISPEGEDKKLNETTVESKQDSASQITPKEESKSDFEGSETGKQQNIALKGGDSRLADKELSQTTGDSKRESAGEISSEESKTEFEDSEAADKQEEENSCLPNTKLSQITSESKQESVGEVTSEENTETNFEDSEKSEKQDTNSEEEGSCLQDKLLNQGTGVLKQELVGQITSEEETKTNFEDRERAEKRSLPDKKLNQEIGELKQELDKKLNQEQELVGQITSDEQSKIDVEGSKPEEDQDINQEDQDICLPDKKLNQGTSELKQELDKKLNQETGELQLELVGQITSKKESKIDVEGSKPEEEQDINQEGQDIGLPDIKFNQGTGELIQELVGQITSEEKSKIDVEGSKPEEEQDICLPDKKLNQEIGELNQELVGQIKSEEENKIYVEGSKPEEEQDINQEGQDICLPDKKLNHATDESVDQIAFEERSKVDNFTQDETTHLLDKCSRSRVAEAELVTETKYDIDTKDSTDGQKSDIESSTITQISDTESSRHLDHFKSKMADLSEKLSEQQQENSDLKLQLNAIQQAKASLELEIRQKEEIIIKTQAEALKNEQSFKQEIKQLREELKENSKLIEKDSNKELQDQLKEAKAREAKAVAELGQKTKDVLDFQKIMEEYEKAIAARFTEYKKLKEDHETATRHLTNIEMAFSDVHQKYERAKVIIEGFKTNEETLKTDRQAYEKLCKQHEERYESLKAHAKGQIEKSNKEILALRDKYEMDVNKLKAIIKRLEIKCSSLEVSLQQKTEECTALSALCDEVTGKKV